MSSCCRRATKDFRSRCSKRWLAAVAPVVSDIESGVPEIVETGVNGERPPIGDVRAFAGAIARLDRDRGRLEAMSAAARQAVARSVRYSRSRRRLPGAYARWRELYRPLGAGSISSTAAASISPGFRIRSCVSSARRCGPPDDRRRDAGVDGDGASEAVRQPRHDRQNAMPHARLSAYRAGAICAARRRFHRRTDSSAARRSTDTTCTGSWPRIAI